MQNHLEVQVQVTHVPAKTGSHLRVMPNDGSMDNLTCYQAVKELCRFVETSIALIRRSNTHQSTECRSFTRYNLQFISPFNSVRKP